MTTQNDSAGVPGEKIYPPGFKNIMELFMELFDIGPLVAIAAVLFTAAVLVGAVIYFVRSAPPSTIVISTGPDNSVFQRYAQKYAKILESNGVKAQILPSKGSIENLDRLADPKSGVEVGLVQGGINHPANDKLISLGGVAYQPIMVFYRGKKLELLSELAGKRVAIGPIGSGTRNIALALLAANGIKEDDGKTTLLDYDAEDSAKGLMESKVDAAFVMSESAAMGTLRSLLRSTEVHLYSFKQAVAYSRKIDFLSVLELPEGAIDIGANLPAQDVTLMGPTVELIAKKNLHPALIGLLIEAATEVHGRPGIYQKRGEFPSPVEHAIKVSDDATQYYKSGKSFLYRLLPFWIANVLSRVVLVFIPVLVILIPALRSIPAFFRWTTQKRIHRRYRELRALEGVFFHETDPAKRQLLRKELDRIDEVVNRMKIRAAFADQLYALRGHIDYVRRLVEARG